MGLVTLAQLRTRVRELADMEDDATFVDNAELDGHINRALWALDDKIHATWEDYYALEVPVTFTGTTHALPADFYKLVAVDVRGSNSDWYPLEPYSLAERNAYRNLRSARPEEMRYRVMGKSLAFLPGFSSATSALLTYYPQVAALEEVTDTREYPNGWEQWACLQAAIIVMTKEERDPGALVSLLNAETARIEASAPIRDAAPVRFVDVETLGTGLGPDGISRWRR